jgi:DNA-directed RNA polymerase delta subunit
MAKVSKAEVDKNLREFVFNTLFNDTVVAETGVEFTKINDRQYGILLTDLNGEQRYIRIGAIVAELRDDMTAEELMQSEIDAYTAKQDAKAEKEKKKAEKIAKDKAKREAEKES